MLSFPGGCNDSECNLKVLRMCHSTITLSCKIQTPLTFGLGVQMHHDHGSKKLIDVLSLVGYCINYDEVRKFITAVALYQLQSPSLVQTLRGISKFDPEQIGTIIDAATDNFDQNEETVEGKHTSHTMASVMYQRSSVLNNELTLIQHTKQKTLTTEHCAEEQVQRYRKPHEKPVLYPFDTKDSSSKAVIKDFVLGMARQICADKRFSRISAWSWFNALMYTRIVPTATIRYPPLLLLSPSDFSTIYTSLLKLVRICEERSWERTTLL